MEKKIVLRNICFAVALQIVSILSGFIIPKVILRQFGSEVNGLISSINQFLNYIQLLEGGLSGVIMAALYKPLNDGDNQTISSIIKATQSFFYKVGIIYVFYAIGVAFIYPCFVKTGFSYQYSIMLVLVLAMNLFVQYFFSITFKILLNADRKVFFVSLTQMIIIILNTLSVVLCTKWFNDILIIKLVSAIIFFFQPILFHIFVKKHYCLDPSSEPNQEALKQRWNGFGVNIAFFIHTNTDVVILTLLSTLSSVSIYSVYLMIINALKNLVVSISQAIVPSFGKTIASGDKGKMDSVFDKFEFVIYFISTILFTCGIILITPFVKVYTQDIHDANYDQATFGILLTLAEMIYCVRDPYVAVSYSVGHFKQISKYAYAEAAMNIFLSVILVFKFGIIGIAIGTLVSMLYRMCAHIYYIKKNIMFRSYKKAIKAFTIFGGVVLVCYLSITNILTLEFSGYVLFFLYAAMIFIIVSAVTFLSSFLFYRDEVKYLIKR